MNQTTQSQPKSSCFGPWPATERKFCIWGNRCMCGIQYVPTDPNSESGKALADWYDKMDRAGRNTGD